MKKSWLAILLLPITPVAFAMSNLPSTCKQKAHETFDKHVYDFFVRGNFTSRQLGRMDYELEDIGVFRGHRYYVHGSGRIQIIDGPYSGQRPGVSGFLTLEHDVSGSGTCRLVHYENAGTFPLTSP